MKRSSVLRRATQGAQVGQGLAAIWSGMGLAQALEHVAALRGDRVAVTLEQPLSIEGFEMRRWTYRDMARFVERAAAALMGPGQIRPGDTVALCMANGFELPLLMLAVARCGAVAVPLNHHLRAEEIGFIVGDCGAAAVVVDESVLGDGLSRWWEQSESGSTRVLVSGRVPQGFEGRCAPLWSSGLVEDTRAPMCPVDQDAVCAIFYTSGTTGFPKGAMLTSRSLLSDQRFLMGLPTLLPTAALMALPMAHIMGFVCLLFCVLAGVEVVYLARFNAGAVLDWMASGRVDGFVGVPSMYQLLSQARAFERDLSGMKVFVSGADVMPADLIDGFKAAGRLVSLGPVQVPAAFVEAYGSVELSGAAMVRVSLPWLSAQRGGFVGWPLPGYQVRIADESDQVIKPGEIGHLQIRGRGMLKGYMGREGATRDAITSDGWLRTGDLASRSRLGVVRFAGRQKDVIKVGGYSVFPAEVESALLGHPDVVKAVVVGVEDALKGARPVAVVCLRGGSDASGQEIGRWVSQRVARYKAPRQVHVWDAARLPYGPTGKVLKRRVAAVLGGQGD